MDDDSLMKAYTCAITKDLEDLRRALEARERESVLAYVVYELQEAAKRSDWTKISQILLAVSKDKVSWTFLTVLSSLRLSYWMGYRQGPPPFEWLNPYTRNPQTTNSLQEVDIRVKKRPPM